jgi:hypothetical protein
MASVQKTYLQLVNKVLLNIRETQVTDLTADYSKLIGEFVNQAKEKVEDEWRWKALQSSFSFTTVASQTAYPIFSGAAAPAVTSSSGNWPTARAEILVDENENQMVFDVTTASSGGFIRLGSATRATEFALNKYMATQAPTQPNRFSYFFDNSVGQGLFTLVGAPLGSRSLVIQMKTPQDEFSTGSEIILVPWRPIVSYATFLAMEERGEELSERSSLYLDRHNSELQRSIEQDQVGEQEYLQLKNLDAGSGYGSLTSGIHL